MSTYNKFLTSAIDPEMLTRGALRGKVENVGEKEPKLANTCKQVIRAGDAMCEWAYVLKQAGLLNDVKNAVPYEMANFVTQSRNRSSITRGNTDL